MFGFFRRKPPFVPPTERQLSYAKRLGIGVTAKMSRQSLSDAISAAEKKQPEEKQKRESISRKRASRSQTKWEDECGPELLESERHWQSLVDDDAFILAAYQKGERIIVDVLRVYDAAIDGDKKKVVVLSAQAPKAVKDRYIGDYLDWDRAFNLRLDKLHYHEVLAPGFADAGLLAYRKAVEKGLAIAKKLKIG